MFAAATPQTIKLPDSVTITFRVDPGDVSKCFMDVMVEGGDVHTVQFNVRGQQIDHSFHPAGDGTDGAWNADVDRPGNPAPPPDMGGNDDTWRQ
jgi:hypothetical protein